MADLIAIRKQAEAVAHQAMRQTRGNAETAALLAENMHALVDAGFAASRSERVCR
jgi:hypothetical protein